MYIYIDLSLSLSLTHTDSLSLSLACSHTHTHTHTQGYLVYRLMFITLDIFYNDLAFRLKLKVQNTFSYFTLLLLSYSSC